MLTDHCATKTLHHSLKCCQRSHIVTQRNLIALPTIQQRRAKAMPGQRRLPPTLLGSNFSTVTQCSLPLIMLHYLLVIPFPWLFCPCPFPLLRLCTLSSWHPPQAFQPFLKVFQVRFCCPHASIPLSSSHRRRSMWHKLGTGG